MKKRKSQSGPRAEGTTVAPASHLADAMRELALAHTEPILGDPVFDPGAGPVESEDAKVPTNGQEPLPAPAELPSSVEPVARPPSDSDGQVVEPPPEPPVLDAPAPPVAAVFLAPQALTSSPDTFQPLEQRIRRLEDALAQLQARQQPGGPPPSERVRRERPPSATFLLDVGKRLFGPSAPEAPPKEPAPRPPETHRWLLTELLAEARAIVRMYVDPRYRLSWFGRVVPLGLVAAIATSGFWVLGSSIPVLGTLLTKAIDLALAFVLFKVLNKEARRYRETAPDLPPSLRL